MSALHCIVFSLIDNNITVRIQRFTSECVTAAGWLAVMVSPYNRLRVQVFYY